jgi:hypothetical protein
MKDVQFLSLAVTAGRGLGHQLQSSMETGVLKLYAAAESSRNQP